MGRGGLAAARSQSWRHNPREPAHCCMYSSAHAESCQPIRIHTSRLRHTPRETDCGIPLTKRSTVDYSRSHTAVPTNHDPYFESICLTDAFDTRCTHPSPRACTILPTHHSLPSPTVRLILLILPLLLLLILPVCARLTSSSRLVRSSLRSSFSSSSVARGRSNQATPTAATSRGMWITVRRGRGGRTRRRSTKHRRAQAGTRRLGRRSKAAGEPGNVGT